MGNEKEKREYAMSSDQSHSGWWYPPEYELHYGGKTRLVEPGELFRLTGNYRNDDKMIELRMVRRAEKRDGRVHCDDCGKYFTGREGKRYYHLHRENGCGRDVANMVFYGDEAVRRHKTGKGYVDIYDHAE